MKFNSLFHFLQYMQYIRYILNLKSFLSSTACSKTFNSSFLKAISYRLSFPVAFLDWNRIGFLCMHSLQTFKEAGIHKKTKSSYTITYKLNAKIYAKKKTFQLLVELLFLSWIHLRQCLYKESFSKVKSQLMILNSAIAEYTGDNKHFLLLVLPLVGLRRHLIRLALASPLLCNTGGRHHVCSKLSGWIWVYSNFEAGCRLKKEEQH